MIEAALKQQQRARYAYISLDTLRGDNPIEPGTWTWHKLREMQGWQRTASRKAREHLFALIDERSEVYRSEARTGEKS